MRDRMFRNYKATEIHTSDPGRLILMLYEGAVRALENAKVFAERKDHEGRAKQLNRATGIVSELLACLDQEKGGQLSRYLAGLYGFVLRRILDANMRNDLGAIDECLQVMLTLQDGWKQIVERPAQSHNMPAPTMQDHMAGLTA